MDAFGHAFPAGAIQEFVRMLRGHLDGVLCGPGTEYPTAPVEGMNNKIKSISHRSFGPNGAELHCSDLSLLRKVAAPSRR